MSLILNKWKQKVWNFLFINILCCTKGTIWTGMSLSISPSPYAHRIQRLWDTWKARRLLLYVLPTSSFSCRSGPGGASSHLDLYWAPGAGTDGILLSRRRSSSPAAGYGWASRLLSELGVEMKMENVPCKDTHITSWVLSYTVTKKREPLHWIKSFIPLTWSSYPTPDPPPQCWGVN